MSARNRASLAQRIVDDPRQAIALVLRNNPEAVTAALFRMGYDARTTRERVDVLRTLDKRSLMEALSVDLRLDRLSASDIAGLQRIAPANAETGMVRTGFGAGPEGGSIFDDIADATGGSEGGEGGEEDSGDGDGGGGFDWVGLVGVILGAGVDLMDDGSWNMLMAHWMGWDMPGQQPPPPPPAQREWVTPLVIFGGLALLGLVVFLVFKVSKK